MINVESTSPDDRPPITEHAKTVIRDIFIVVPEGKKSALLAIYDIDNNKGRLHYAWKVNNVWKVGAQVGWTLHSKPHGFVGLEAAW